ncbi:MAG: ISNCY family transposase [Gemmatimonadota bacterium]
MLLLSAKERDRLVQLRAIVEDRVSVSEAARRLGLSRRHLRRLVRRFQQQGDGAVVHRARGRPPNNRQPAALRERALARAREPAYEDFGPTLLSEHLARDPQIGLVNRHTLRRWMIAEGLWKPRRHRPRHRTCRPRRPAFGELVLMDTSEHAWLEDRYTGPMALIASIDDASSEVGARFVERDTGEDNRRFLIEYLAHLGRPRAFYVDRASHFGNARRPRPSRRQPLPAAREAEPTHSIIQTALEALDVELIFAFSPQAKGRVERLFGSLQDRLVKELRVARIDSLEGANRFLETVFLPTWNRTFTVEPSEHHDAHRPLPPDADLLALFAELETRVVAHDFTFKYQGRKLQILATDAGDIQPGERVTIELRLDGSTHFRHHHRYLEPEPIRPPTPKPRTQPRPPVVTPAPDHPWRRRLNLRRPTPR